jgi:hypothetical protein
MSNGGEDREWNWRADRIVVRYLLARRFDERGEEGREAHII